MLANFIVFELLHFVVRGNESESYSNFCLLDLDTLEGKRHSFLPHPLVTGCALSERIPDIPLRLEQIPFDSEPSGELLSFFSQLTSAESGIFQISLNYIFSLSITMSIANPRKM
jgi:hypothetical protein